MKVSLNGNELKLVQTMMTLLEAQHGQIADLQELYAYDYDMSANEFNYTYGRLAHKLAQQLGKKQIKVEAH